MKIGILTFHFSINYGAVIQAWALQTYLRSLGHDVVILNYTPQMRRFPWYVHAVRKGLRRFALEFLFRRFAKRNLVLSKSIASESDIAELGLDFCIAGSDQVWNLSFFNFDRHYFLDFVPNGVRKVAYAASVGEGNWDEHKEELSSLIRSFSAISVRENFAKRVVDGMEAGTCYVVPDPTLLLERRDYEQLIKHKQKDTGRFRIFVYGLNAVDRCVRVLRTVLSSHPLAEVRLMCLSRSKIKECGIRLKSMNLSPQEWLQEIVSADLVITDSFHGVAISTVLGKKFLTFYKDEEPNARDRIATLVASVGLASNVIDVADFKYFSLDKVGVADSQALSTYRKMGASFLHDALRVCN